MKARCLFWLATIVFALSAAAQTSTRPANPEGPMQRYVRMQLGRDLGFLYENSIIADGKMIQFLPDNRPIFYFCGMEGCVPCDAQTPYLMQLAQKYQDMVRFVYLTYNTFEQTVTHLKQLGFPYFNQTIGVLSLPQTYIVSNRIGFGYPTKFITDKRGIVRFVEVVAAKDKSEMLQIWETNLNQIVKEGSSEK